jgi:integrase
MWFDITDLLNQQSKRLGHATVAITMEIYVHIRPTMEKDYIQNFSLHPTKTWV